MERKLAAIFSADVQGYSRLMGDDEEATIRTLTAYREVMTSLIQQHRGRVVDSPGDNLLAEFGSAVDAVYDQIANKLDFSYAYQGEQTVKNIAQPVRVYRVQLDAKKAAAPIDIESATALPLPDKPSIAVLPFTNMSNDPEQEYFSDGMTDDLITDLSKISGLFVIARNSVFAYKGQTVNIPEVGRALGVRHILESSVRKAGNQVRINVQLIEAATGGHVWAERYDRELKDIFALQDDVRQKIVRALEVKLTAQEQGRVGLTPTGNLESYDYFLRGIESMGCIPAM